MVAAAVACTSQPPPAADPLAGYRLVDLTHPFDETTVFWPTGQPFRHERTAWGRQPAGYWYSSYDLAMSEHCGTHLDAPIHFAEGKPAVGDLSLDQLSGRVAVIDIEAQCEANPDYTASPSDLAAYEARHGTVAGGSIVLFRTGWSRRWPDTDPGKRRPPGRSARARSVPAGIPDANRARLGRAVPDCRLGALRIAGRLRTPRTRGPKQDGSGACWPRWLAAV